MCLANLRRYWQGEIIEVATYSPSSVHLMHLDTEVGMGEEEQLTTSQKRIAGLQGFLEELGPGYLLIQLLARRSDTPRSGLPFCLSL
jgi:hypothetical protein